MNFVFAHNNINVTDIDASIAFYEEALTLETVRRVGAPDGSFKLAFLQGKDSPHQLELTWLRDRTTPYNLGDNEFHLAFYTDDFDAAFAKHKAMNAVVFENTAMNVYFIADPDGYWTEIIPAKPSVIPAKAGISG
jgi:lactoylglutathione lyase